MVERRMIEQPDDDRRPYPPAANVLAVIERVRRLNLPAAVDTDFLRLADVPEGSLGRVAFALRFLGLTDANARPTDQLRAMARATDEEYQELMAGTVRSAYATDFERINPAVETQAKIISAFQRYEPRSQTTRMVMLFLGLCRAAGIPVLDAPRERGMQGTRTASSSRQGVGRPTTRQGSTAPKKERESGARPVIDNAARLRGQALTFDLSQLDLIDDDADFEAVWAALGKAQRIIGKARRSVAELEQKLGASETEDGGQ